MVPTNPRPQPPIPNAPPRTITEVPQQSQQQSGIPDNATYLQQLLAMLMQQQQQSHPAMRQYSNMQVNVPTPMSASSSGAYPIMTGYGLAPGMVGFNGPAPGMVGYGQLAPGMAGGDAIPQPSPGAVNVPAPDQ